METADVSDESTVSVFRVWDWRWRQKSLRNFFSSTRLHGNPSHEKALCRTLSFTFLDFTSGRYTLWKNKSVGGMVRREENSLATIGNRNPDFLAAQSIHWLELSQFI